MAAESGSFVLVQDGNILCCFLSPGYPNDYVTFKSVSDIDDYGYTLGFEKDGETNNYFIKFFNQASTPSLLGYINASQYSHSFMASSINAQKGTDGANGALWTITEVGENTKQYAIRNVGVADGTIGSIATSKGYLKIIPSGYWANHVTIDNESGPTWQFYTLTTTTLPDEDPIYFGWDGLTFSTSPNVTVDPDNRFVRDANGWAPYGQETAKWEFATPRDLSDYRYLVFYVKRNAVQWGNGDNTTGGSVFIRDNSGTSFRCNDYVEYTNSESVKKTYPDHTGNMWMERWNQQRATVIDLQWLANTDKYGDGSECKVLDITKIKAFGFAGDFCIGGAFLTNTLPSVGNSAGDYKRAFTETDKFGTICLSFNAVCCGANIYEITGSTGSGITLAEHEGIMEAGKPYFYKTLQAKKQDEGIVDETNVFFYKAGYATVASPVANNGLVGTFSEITLTPNDNYYVLSNNTLYKVDAGATGENAVTIGANKAYVDISQIVNKSRGAVFLDFDEPTGVNEVRGQKKDVRSDFFNLAGQRVAQPTKGLYIVNGKKVIIK